MPLDLSLVRNEMSGMNWAWRVSNSESLRRGLTSAPYSPTLTFEEMVVASRRRFLAGADSFCLAVFGIFGRPRSSLAIGFATYTIGCEVY